MDTLVHADIFFFVTTIAVVVVAAVFTIALIYLVKILNDVKHISRQVKEETVLFREDLKGLREDVRRDGFKLTSMLSFLTKFFSARKASRSKSKSK